MYSSLISTVQGRRCLDNKKAVSSTGVPEISSISATTNQDLALMNYSKTELVLFEHRKTGIPYEIKPCVNIIMFTIKVFL